MAIPLLAQVPQPLGRLVDIGGRKLHLHCTGSGSPTVILEAGASSFSIDWSLVQPEIAKANRVCSYDRARMGWSDVGEADIPANVVQDLRKLLTTANEKGPYVLVGASMGGIYVRLFRLRYPSDVKGLVLVDPTHESRLYTTLDGKGVSIASLTAEQLLRTLPKGEVKIPRRKVQTGEPFDRLPSDLYKARLVLDQRLIDSYPPSVGPEIVAEKAEGDRASLAELQQERTNNQQSLGDLPLVILTRGVDTNDERKAAYEELARISTRSRHTVVAEAGHEIHLFQPRAVIEAIQEVVRMSRAR